MAGYVLGTWLGTQACESHILAVYLADNLNPSQNLDLSILDNIAPGENSGPDLLRNDEWTGKTLAFPEFRKFLEPPNAHPLLLN